MTIQVKLFKTQRDFMRALLDPTIEQIGYGGARGGGKSHVLRAGLISRALVYPGSRHLLLRRTRDDVVEQHEAPLINFLTDHGIDFRYKASTTTFNLPGRSVIKLGFAERVRHAEKYQGTEYLTVAFDEATQFEEPIFDRIGGSVRVAVEGAPKTKKILTCNPGGIGHSWIKRRFVKPATRDANTIWIPARLRDNCVLQRRDPSYADRLVRGLPAAIRRQWLDGDWDVSEGQYFELPAGAIKDVVVPSWARRTAGVDWGYRAAFAVVWIATWRDGAGRERCHVECELKQPRLELDEQAAAALAVEEHVGIKGLVRVRWADPSTGRKTEGLRDDATKSVALTWSKLGFNTMPAAHPARVPGWMMIRQMMAPYHTPPGYPHGMLTISPKCAALIQEIQDAVFPSDMSGDDIDERCEDHALDALRYAVSMAYGMNLPEDPVELAAARLKTAYDSTRQNERAAVS